MKKKALILMIMILSIMLTSCSLIPASRLEAMFSSGSDTVIRSGEATVNSSDSVVISKEEYEKYQKFSELFTIFEAANEDFYQEPDQDKMIEYAVRGLMSGLDDPYSFYYNPEEYAEMWEEDEGNYVGIGVLIQANMETQICTIVRVFKDGPAEKAGVQRGDILYKVGDDLFVNADNLQDAVDIMRGVPDTDVDVTFLRGDEEIKFTITRKPVNVNQVESKMIDQSIGYIALYQFAGQCEKEFESDLNRLIEQGAKGIIIDLRDNTGGWVDQARYIADLFMDKGDLCYLVYRNGEEERKYPTKNGKTDVKLTVLVNEMSASSSEILTGALRDCADATIVGTKTFGKGIVQSVLPIGTEGAGLQITIAEYFTPNGNKVHEIGITPDVIVERPEGDSGTYDFADTGKDIQLKTALETMKDKLK